MSVAQYGRQFPILLRMSNPRGHVELLETIGKGNYGYVYKGKLLKKNSQLAAIKVVFLKEDEIKETLLEMEILESCSHPNITGYLGCFLKGLDLWICMEFCGAGSVDTIYRSLKRQVPENAIASILYESILGLEYLHIKAGLIHRDIKAGNLLLTLDGIVKLADFGVSAQLDTIGGFASTFIGTPYWMAPEVIACDPDASPSSRPPKYNDKSDIWSIGITAIEISEKNPPLSDIHPMQALHLIAKSDIGFAKPKNFSKPFVDFVMYCLNKNPAKRPSASDCLRHPFMEMAASLNRQQILSEIVGVVQTIKERKKKGLDVSEHDETALFASTSSAGAGGAVAPSDYSDTSDNGRRPSAASSSNAGANFATLTKNIFGFSKSSSPSLSRPSNNGQSSVVAAPTLAIQASQIKDSDLQTLVTSPSFIDFPAVINHVSEGCRPIFEPIALTSLLSDQCTADFLDGQYILLGCEKGLFYLDITKPSQKTPIPIIHDVKFSQIQVLHDYNVMIALSGRHSHIRQYSLASIRKLILYVEGNAASIVSESQTDIPIQQVVLGRKKEQVDEYDQYRQSSDASYSSGGGGGGGVRDEASLVSQWTHDFLKIPDTRDSKSFSVELTESSAFISIILYQGITVFRWAQAPYEKFMKIKSFWVPETPQFVVFAQDGLAPTHLYIGYTHELNKVTISDSQVKELAIHKEMKSKGMRKPRWQCIRQIPFADSKLEEMLRRSGKSGTMIGGGGGGVGARKNAALAMGGGPTINRGAAGLPDDRYFLATFDRLTKVVDHRAHPMIGAGVGGWKDGVMWSEPPQTQILRPLQHVISLGKSSIEIVEWKSALLRQRMSLDDPTASFKVLADRHGYSLIGVEKKKKGVMIYWMRENSPPPRPPGELLKKVMGEAMPRQEMTLKESFQTNYSQSQQQQQQLQHLQAAENRVLERVENLTIGSIHSSSSSQSSFPDNGQARSPTNSSEYSLSPPNSSYIPPSLHQPPQQQQQQQQQQRKTSGHAQYTSIYSDLAIPSSSQQSPYNTQSQPLRSNSPLSSQRSASRQQADATTRSALLTTSLSTTSPSGPRSEVSTFSTPAGAAVSSSGPVVYSSYRPPPPQRSFSQGQVDSRYQQQQQQHAQYLPPHHAPNSPYYMNGGVGGGVGGGPVVLPPGARPILVRPDANGRPMYIIPAAGGRPPPPYYQQQYRPRPILVSNARPPPPLQQNQHQNHLVSSTYSQMYEQANHGQVVYQKGAGGMIYTQGPPVPTSSVRPSGGGGGGSIPIQYRPPGVSAQPRPTYSQQQPQHSQQQRQQQQQHQYFTEYKDD